MSPEPEMANDYQTVALGDENPHAIGDDTDTAYNPEHVQTQPSFPFSNVSRTSMPPEQSRQGPRGWRQFFGKRDVKPESDDQKEESEVKVTGTSSSNDEEIVDLETHWHTISEEDMRSLSVDYHPTRQLFGLLWQGLRMWLMTAVLISAWFVSLWFYALKAVMTTYDKNISNFLNLAFGLALGIAIGKGYNTMAGNMRWWLISIKRRTPLQMDAILRIESLTETAKLIFIVPTLAPLCILWIVYWIGAQAAVAAVGLTYSLDSSTGIALTQPGNVTIPDLSHITSQTGAKVSLYGEDSERYLANSYGTIALPFKSGDLSLLPEPRTQWQSSSQSYTIFTTQPDSSAPVIFQYNFMDTSPGVPDPTSPDGFASQPITVYTDRSVNVTTSCTSFSVSSGGNGSADAIQIITNGNGGKKKIPMSFAHVVDQTTYWTDIENDNGTCGRGCMTVRAFEASNDNAYYYECNVTVSEVHNATREEHNISDNLRQMAAGGIAMQGFIDDFSQQSNTTAIQSQGYPAQSDYGWPAEGNVQLIGAKLGYFAVGIVAVTAEYNDMFTVWGDQPQAGSTMTVKWSALYTIFGLLAGLQMILMVLTTFIANMVMVRDDSALATARLLRPLVERLGPAGTTASGKEIAKVLGDGGNTKVVYSVRHPEAGQKHHLDVGLQRRLRAFPSGNYD